MRYFAVAIVCFQIAAGLAGVAFAQMKKRPYAPGGTV